MKYILAIDQGTSSTRSIIFDENGTIRGSAQEEFTQYYPKEAWVEHDANEIKNTVLNTMKSALEQAKLGYADISAIGITNQRETIVAWDKESGQPLDHAIVWQCRRSTDIVSTLKEDGYEDVFHRKSGLVLDAYFSGTKIKWMLDNNEKIAAKHRNNEVAFGTIDSWIIQFLSGEHKTDASNASRTLLYDLTKDRWSSELSEILGVSVESLPEVHNNADSEPFGYFKKEGNEIPIRGVLGDQQAALFGQIAFEKGDVKTTYGTGNFTLTNTGTDIQYSQNGLLTTVAWELDNQLHYALEGSVFISGAALRWLRDGLGIINDYAEIDQLARSVKNSGGVYFVPAFVGLGAPHWDSTARGMMIGITGGTSKAHLIRATLDSIAYQTNDLLHTMEEDTGIKLRAMRVDGGITQSDMLMQQQANISQLNIEIPRITETTAMGAALMAGYREVWEDMDELKNINNTAKSFSPEMDPDEVKTGIEKWQRAVKRSKNWIE